MLGALFWTSLVTRIEASFGIMVGTRLELETHLCPSSWAMTNMLSKLCPSMTEQDETESHIPEIGERPTTWKTQIKSIYNSISNPKYNKTWLLLKTY